MKNINFKIFVKIGLILMIFMSIGIVLAKDFYRFLIQRLTQGLAVRE